MADNSILVIDDSHVISSLLDDFLTEKGFRVSLASSAEEAFVKIKEKLPDLIVLDLVLPDVHGFQFCRVLKSDPKTRRIPVIMVTAKAIEVRDKVEGLKVGADDYMTKPFELSEFYERVNAILRRVELSHEKGHEVDEELKNVEAVVETPLPTGPERPGLKGWQKFTSLLVEPGWFFSWVLSGPSQNKEFGFGFLVVCLIPVVSTLGKLLQAGSRVGPEALNGAVQALLFVVVWSLAGVALQLAFSLSGKKTSFKTVASILGLSMTSLLIGKLLELVYILSGGRAGEFSSDATLFLTHFFAKGSLGFILHRMDLFEIWAMCLAGIGVSQLLNVSKKKSFLLVSCLWLVVLTVGAFLTELNH